MTVSAISSPSVPPTRPPAPPQPPVARGNDNDSDSDKKGGAVSAQTPARALDVSA